MCFFFDTNLDDLRIVCERLSDLLIVIGYRVCAVKAEDNKIPPRSNSKELIAVVMALPEEEHTYSKIFRLGKDCLDFHFGREVSGRVFTFISWRCQR